MGCDNGNHGLSVPEVCHCAWYIRSKALLTFMLCVFLPSRTSRCEGRIIDAISDKLTNLALDFTRLSVLGGFDSAGDQKLPGGWQWDSSCMSLLSGRQLYIFGQHP